MLAGDVLEGRSLDPVSIHPYCPIPEAAQQMSQFRIGILVVVDEENHIVGVVSERDIAFAVGNPELELADTKVRDLMARKVMTCDENTSISDAAYAMNMAGLRHIIVAHGNKPVGVLSMRDIVRSIKPLLEEYRTKIEGQLMKEILRSLEAA